MSAAETTTAAARLRDLGAARDLARAEYLAAARQVPRDSAERGRRWRAFLEAHAAYDERRARGGA